jgi:cation diffusion facilitator CzcD-associated flavoprotein CzcO
MDKVDIAIIGAGPSALCLLNRLEQRHPLWFPDSEKTGETAVCIPKIKVFDASGAWLGKWKRLFSDLEIEYLRSPSLFHVESIEGDGLLHYAIRNNHKNAIEEIHDVLKFSRKRGYLIHNIGVKMISIGVKCSQLLISPEWQILKTSFLSHMPNQQ